MPTHDLSLLPLRVGVIDLNQDFFISDSRRCVAAKRQRMDEDNVAVMDRTSGSAARNRNAGLPVAHNCIILGNIVGMKRSDYARKVFFSWT